ncbi:MAG: autotransporter-associated beta strand repeat-containing protein, partial [Clostridia bacterium]|nr:autotransporter-associated beta strand repeat-containing protein [Clostridia bacterium]
TLNLYGGAFTNAYLLLVGHNGGSSTINLHGGVLNSENITHIKYAKGSTDNTTYRVFNNTEGETRIYWNGGTFMPNSAKMANDPLASDANNATLGGLTEVLVSTNGAVLSTSTLVADTYTIAQPLLHDPALEGESDGGLTVRGNAAKTVALTGANTYTGDTTVEEGTLSIPADADASVLPADSAVVVAEGATLSMANGTAAGVGALRFDMGIGGDRSILLSYGNIYTAFFKAI